MRIRIPAGHQEPGQRRCRSVAHGQPCTVPSAAVGLWAATFFALALLALLAPASASESFPRIANIYFPDLRTADLNSLARWDALIVPKRAVDTGLDEIETLRTLNPDILIIAHMPVGYHGDWMTPPINGDLVSELFANDWWLKDTGGERMTLPCGDGILNGTIWCPESGSGDRLCDWLAEYIAERLGPAGPFDGVFLDCCFDEISWVNNVNDLPADADGDGEPDDPAELNAAWRAGMEILTLELRELVGDDFIVTTNGNNTYYEQCNGSTREGFPHMHGDWYENITNPVWGYEAICSKFDGRPGFSTVNTMWDGEVVGGELVRDEAFEDKFTFTFASVLVYGDGYFSFDGGEGLPEHSQDWWHDWYDVDLGKALGRSEEVPKSIEWVSLAHMVRARRFERGVVVVNPTSVTQRVDLGAQYAPLSSHNGLFYPYLEHVKKVNVERQSGALVVGSGRMLLMQSGLQAERGESGVVTLSWEPVHGAARYSVYKAHRPEGTTNPIYLESVVTEPCFVDTLASWESAFYRVAPIDDIGCEGPPSVMAGLRPDQARAMQADDENVDEGMRSRTTGADDELNSCDVPGRADGTGAGAWHETMRAGEEYARGCAVDVDGAAEPRSDGSAGVDVGESGPVRPVTASPNPVFASTRIACDVGPGSPLGKEVGVAVYDIRGRLVTRLRLEPAAGGWTGADWDLTARDGSRVAPGCYLMVTEGLFPPARGKVLVLPEP